MAKVELYTKTFCGYCVRARHLLESKGIEFVEYVIDGGGPKREEMIHRAGGRTTVPQIFIDDRHVGGCSDLFELESGGGLDGILSER